MLRVRVFVALIAILSAILIIGQKTTCHFSKEIASNNKSYERSLIDDFISYTMVRYFGVYTLFGLKPITEIDMQYQPPTEKERQQMYDSLTITEQQKIPYEDFILKSPWAHSTKDQWQAFNNEIKKIDLKDYFFVETRYNYEDKDINSLLFIHSPALIKLLDGHHDQFEKELGCFNTIEKISELKNGGSKFWDKIFKEDNHYLLGLVLGFGEINSKLFNEECNGNKKRVDQRVNHTSLEELKNILKDDFFIEDLCIPQFISYQAEDELVHHYKKGRKKIIERLKDKDLTQEVLSLLQNGVERL